MNEKKCFVCLWDARNVLQILFLDAHLALVLDFIIFLLSSLFIYNWLSIVMNSQASTALEMAFYLWTSRL